MNILTSLASHSNNPLAVEGVALGIVLLLYVMAFVFGIVVYAIYAYLLARIFKKAGLAEWIAWVPFYNSWKLLEIGGQQGFWAVLAVIPIINIVSTVFIYIAMYNVGLKLGKDGWWVVIAIFIPIVWFAVLAFDKSKWNPNVATV